MSDQVPLPFPVAILAGGLATRMRPLTDSIPKSLLEVAGKPFLTHQLALLKHQGIQRAVLCLGHLGEQIRDRYGDGEHHGISLQYSFDGPRRLGTGGALRRALPLLGDTFFVLYGDSYLTADFRAVAAAYAAAHQPGLMTVYRNEGRFDTSNVTFVDGRIIRYNKRHPAPDMRHIDYGLSVFQAQILQAYPEDQVFDLATVMEDLVGGQRLAGFEVHERFYEIGSPQGLRELEQYLARRGARPETLQ